MNVTLSPKDRRRCIALMSDRRRDRWWAAAMAAVMAISPLAAQSLTVTTIAGQVLESGSADGTGASARFSYISAMTTDAGGNIIALDANNFTVRKITPDGVVTTIAGAARVREYRDGAGSNAHFYQPRGLARDSLDNVHIGDFNPPAGDFTIRKITPAGIVTTYITRVSASALAMDVGDYLVVGGSSLRAYPNNRA